MIRLLPQLDLEGGNLAFGYLQLCSLALHLLFELLDVLSGYV